MAACSTASEQISPGPEPESIYHNMLDSPTVLAFQSSDALADHDTPQTMATVIYNTTSDPITTILSQKKWSRLHRALILLVAMLVLGGGTAYATYLSPFPTHTPVSSLAQTTTKRAELASLLCNASEIVKQLTDTAAAPTAAAFAKIQHTYARAPAMSIDSNAHYCVGLNTSRGLVVLELDPSLAPDTVNNFVFLAQHHFYDGMEFHRVVPGFIIQTGSPGGDGTDGPGYSFNDEPVKGEYTQGCVAMANRGPNTNGSQFFICTADDSSLLRKQYNLFGHVVLGMDVAQKIQGPGDTSTSKNIVPDRLNYVTVVPVNTGPHATATTISNMCFLDSSGPRIPAVYEGNATPTSGPTTAPKIYGTPVTLQDGLQYVDMKDGSGTAVQSSNTITANYTGWLASTCQKFGSTYDAHIGQAARPFTSGLNQKQLIKGWAEGLIGMKAGGIRRLYIPAALAYGAQAVGSIPANSDLIFDIQLVSIK